MRAFGFIAVLTAGVSCGLLLSYSTPAHGEEQDQNVLRNAGYHRAQAAEYRQKAAQLGTAIQRYEIMTRVYQNGSDRASGVANPQGRRLMVERTKRVIHHFTQKKHETEQRASDHEALAQALPEP
jgi:hypothetical protein